MCNIHLYLCIKNVIISEEMGMFLVKVIMSYFKCSYDVYQCGSFVLDGKQCLDEY